VERSKQGLWSTRYFLTIAGNLSTFIWKPRDLQVDSRRCLLTSAWRTLP
jgi:hypothetical protein